MSHFGDLSWMSDEKLQKELGEFKNELSQLERYGDKLLSRSTGDMLKELEDERQSRLNRYESKR